MSALGRAFGVWRDYGLAEVRRRVWARVARRCSARARREEARRQLPGVLARLPGSAGLVIFLPSIGWQATLFQRPHHLARALAAAGFVVVFDCSTTPRDTVDGFEEVAPNLFLFSGEAKVLHRLPDAWLWALPYNLHLADSYPEGARVVYDWIDDLSVFDAYPPRLLRRNHERGLATAHVVTAVARTLHDEARLARPDALYLPNAVEEERFRSTGTTPADDPDLGRLLARHPSARVAGYYGALAAWFDFTLVREVARRRPDWVFVLIGPGYDAEGRRGLRAIAEPNVLWLGPRPYESLPGYLLRFEVATIPFVVNAITRATSPLKLYEYLAAGKPVVASPLPECAAYPEVRVAAGADEFARALDAAAEEGRDPAFRERLRQRGRENSWAARVQEVQGALRGHPPRTAAAGVPLARPAPVQG